MLSALKQCFLLIAIVNVVRVVLAGAVNNPLCNIHAPSFSDLVPQDDTENYHTPTSDALDYYMERNTGCKYRTECNHPYDLLTSTYFDGRYEQVFAVRTKYYIQFFLQWSVFDRYIFEFGMVRDDPNAKFYEGDVYRLYSRDMRPAGKLFENEYIFFYIRIENGTMTFGKLCNTEPMVVRNVVIEKGNHVELSFQAWWFKGIKLLYDCPVNGQASSSLVPKHRGSAEWQLYRFTVDDEIELACTTFCRDDPTEGHTYTWLINGTELVVSNTSRPYLTDHGSQLKIRHASENENGDYICIKDGFTARRFRLEAAPYIIKEKYFPLNMKTGQNVTLECKFSGRPYHKLFWTYRKHLSETETDVAVALPGRAVVQTSSAGIPGGQLLLLRLTAADAGVYSCHTRAESVDIKFEEHMMSGSYSRIEQNIVLIVLASLLQLASYQFLS